MAAEAEAEAPAETAESKEVQAAPRNRPQRLRRPKAPGAGGADSVGVVDDDAEPGETMTLLEQALTAKSPVQGQIIGWNKGGYHVALGKIARLLPGLPDRDRQSPEPKR